MRVFRVRKLLELQSKLVNTLLIWCSLEPFIIIKYYYYFLTRYENLFSDKLPDGFSSPYTLLYSDKHLLFPHQCLLFLCSALLGKINQKWRFRINKGVTHWGFWYLLLFPQGRQPFLLHLLSLYKVFCPELVTLSIPSRMRVCTWIVQLMLKSHIWPSSLKHQWNCVFSVFLQSGFRNHNSTWKSALIGVQKRNGSQVALSNNPAFTIKDKTNSRKRVWKLSDVLLIVPFMMYSVCVYVVCKVYITVIILLL